MLWYDLSTRVLSLYQHFRVYFYSLLYFVNYFRFIVKFSPLPVVFSHESFHINLVFFFFASYFIIVSLISTLNALKV